MIISNYCIPLLRHAELVSATHWTGMQYQDQLKVEINDIDWIVAELSVWGAETSSATHGTGMRYQDKLKLNKQC